jgi:flavin reductase (DIM6/NTAB) family NADH-FMN oxidoreductase RutF
MSVGGQSSCEAPAAFDVLALRRALGMFLTGVTIVTTVDATGASRGITANSFTSVSLDPPMVLFCVDRSAASCDAFTRSRGFAVHILGHEQQELASRFASRSAAKFDGLRCREGAAGAPLLPECAAWLDCETEQRIEVGDHIVIVGRVRDFGVEAQRPLAYLQGRFVPLAPEQGLAADAEAHGLTVGWIADTADGRIVLERSAGSDPRWSVPLRRLGSAPLDDDSLARLAAEHLGAPVELHFLYSLYDLGEPGNVVMLYRVRLTAPDLLEPTADRRLLSIDDLPWDDVSGEPMRGILRRYVRERAGGRFGLYAGSSERGRIAAIDDVALDRPAPASEEGARP